MKVGWVKNKLTSWERRNALICVMLDAEAILRGMEFQIGTMREAKQHFIYECYFWQPAL